jgi:hypothetical protein
VSRDPREEAERLVAAALAAVSVAARSTSGFATGSAECCVCPLCKAIAAMRDPDPRFAERLASSVGDLATGLAGVLRTFGDAAPTDGSAKAHDDGETPTATSGDFASRDTSRGSTGNEEKADPAEDVWHAATTPKTKPMAKKAVKKAPPKGESEA